jgi:hypothetical protein
MSDKNFFFHPSLLLLFLDPGSVIRDPGWVKISIRDKHPGSAILTSAFKREHPELQNMNFRSSLPFWVRICIPNADPDAAD